VIDSGVDIKRWIPACAGMTGWDTGMAVHLARLRGNDELERENDGGGDNLLA